MEFFITTLFCLSQFSVMDAKYWIPGIPGVPDTRDTKVKISRGSGMGFIHPGYILLVLLAFGFFVGVFWLILFYKRQGDKKDKQTLFLTSY